MESNVVTPPPFFREAGLTAADAVNRVAEGRTNTRRVRIGLADLHPSFNATYGGLCFHKVTERVSADGSSRTPIRGQILDLSEAQLERVKADAKHKVVRVYGGWSNPMRSEELDVRRIGLGAVQKDDRPVLVLDAKGEPLWSESLLYLEENPNEGERPPVSFYEAIERLQEQQRRQATLPTLQHGPVGQAEAAEQARAGRAGVQTAKRAGLKMTAGGEVTP